jgi:hypothetical protein
MRAARREWLILAGPSQGGRNMRTTIHTPPARPSLRPCPQLC